MSLNGNKIATLSGLGQQNPHPPGSPAWTLWNFMHPFKNPFTQTQLPTSIPYVPPISDPGPNKNGNGNGESKNGGGLFGFDNMTLLFIGIAIIAVIYFVKKK